MPDTRINAALVAIVFGCLAGCDTGTSPDVAGTSSPDIAAGDWQTYNRTLAGDRFSPLAEIDRGNVAALQEVCSYALPEVSSLQTGPLVIAGTMYFTTESASYSIDAATCAEKWRVEHALEQRSPLAVNRGFVYA